MEGNRLEQRGEFVDETLQALTQVLQEATSEDFPLVEIDGTYEIEAESYMLTFTLSKDSIEIRNLDVRNNTGLGGKIVGAINVLADELGLKVTATKVVSTARGFWEAMGYRESEDEGEYYRAS